MIDGEGGQPRPGRFGIRQFEARRAAFALCFGFRSGSGRRYCGQSLWTFGRRVRAPICGSAMRCMGTTQDASTASSGTFSARAAPRRCPGTTKVGNASVTMAEARLPNCAMRFLCSDGLRGSSGQ
jgi:hypothetical protein